jgi:hypothetical protein
VIRQADPCGDQRPPCGAGNTMLGALDKVETLLQINHDA